MLQVLILLWSVLSLDTLSTLIHLSTVDLSGSGSWARGTAGAMVAEVAPVSRPARSAGCRATQIYHELWERTIIYTCWRNVE